MLSPGLLPYDSCHMLQTPVTLNRISGYEKYILIYFFSPLHVLTLSGSN